MDFVLIGSPEIEKVRVEDNREPLIDLAIEFSDLRFDESRKFVQTISPSISFGRRRIGQMLSDAQKFLPAEYRFLIKECYRPLSVQQKFWNDHENYLRKKFSLWSVQEIREECSKYVAPVTVAPHSTGGAVDLILTDSDGEWLDMGSQFNAEPSGCEYRTYFSSDKISETARRNRDILWKAMTSAGFMNYPTEWWHWSYGDKYWAYLTNSPMAHYSSVELSEIYSGRRVEIKTLTGFEARGIVDPFYESLGRKSRARDNDLFFVALLNKNVVGSVRFCIEENTPMLRGMFVSKSNQRQGIGKTILKVFESYLKENNISGTYCLPYGHLEQFYSTIGFKKVDPIIGPKFLQERLDDYLKNHDSNMIMMRRV